MDPTTLDRARAGDSAAMEQLLTEIAPAVHRFGMRMCRHNDDADDVLQDTLLAITQNLASFEGRSSLTSWVFTLARTACARRRRGLKNKAFVAEDAVPEASDSAPSPEDATVSHDLATLVRAALDRLPESFREVIELRDVEDLSAAEAATSLGISVDALKSRLHRARAALRDELRSALEHGPPPGPHCPDVVSALSQKLEGDLDERDCAEMERHLATCRACEETCGALRQALAVCRASSAGPVPPAVKVLVKDALRAWTAARR